MRWESRGIAALIGDTDLAENGVCFKTAPGEDCL
jgi:hypothetical protein